MIAITTGRQTTQRLNSFLKDLTYALPNSKIFRRGKSSLEDLTSRFLDEGVRHAFLVRRSHGVPGRIDLFDVQPSGLRAHPPLILLKELKLKREYQIKGKYAAECITCNSELHQETRDLVKSLADVLGLPKYDHLKLRTVKGSLHVRERPDRTIRVALTSPPGEAEVGPAFDVSKLIWDVSQVENFK